MDKHTAGPWRRLRPNDEFAANAQLIAAAPELLSFVIQYLYSEHGECDPEHEAAPYMPEELRDMARELIIKATSEGR